MRQLCLALALVAALGVAAPARATAGLFCQPAGRGAGPTLSLVITHGLPGGIVGATLHDGRESRTTMNDDSPLALVQSWIDERQIMVDIADRDVTHYVAKLRARPIRDQGAVGTLEVNGRKYRVRCEES
jgi:hypothetical protein